MVLGEYCKESAVTARIVGVLGSMFRSSSSGRSQSLVAGASGGELQVPM